MIERFEAKFIPEPNSGCWLWTASMTNGGYGLFSVRHKNKMAHRVSYELYKGAIPDGLEIDHKCRNRCCVNPSHLEPVSHLENVRRGDGGRNSRDRTHCKKGHPLQGGNVRIYAGKRICRACGRERMALWRAAQ